MAPPHTLASRRLLVRTYPLDVLAARDLVLRALGEAGRLPASSRGSRGVSSSTQAPASPSAGGRQVSGMSSRGSMAAQRRGWRQGLVGY